MTNPDDWRIDHSGIGVTDVAASARFYDAVLGALGLRPIMRISTSKTEFHDGDELGGVAYGASFPIFWIDCFHPAGVQQQHTAFRARSREEVDTFHAAALAAGGQDNGAPGLRAGGYPPGITPRSCLILTATISKPYSGKCNWSSPSFSPHSR